MQKIFAENIDCSNLQDENIMSVFIGQNFSAEERFPLTLTSCVSYFHKNPFCGTNLVLDCGLTDKKTARIAYELAVAVDKNSVEDVKFLKRRYGNEPEFLKAKEFLDIKSKQVWDVFENKNSTKNIPYQAMKVLGITNLPTLDFLLADSLKFYEKDGGSTSVDIMRSILNNKNLHYKFEDIYNFLRRYSKKNCIEYNMKTVSYLMQSLDYDKAKLNIAGVTDEAIKLALSKSSVFDRIKYFYKNYLKKVMFRV